ncbi:unnamed protein product [Ectocarpus sp. 12 AP-2014]
MHRSFRAISNKSPPLQRGLESTYSIAPAPSPFVQNTLLHLARCALVSSSFILFRVPYWTVNLYPKCLSESTNQPQTTSDKFNDANCLQFQIYHETGTDKKKRKKKIKTLRLEPNPPSAIEMRFYF